MKKIKSTITQVGRTLLMLTLSIAATCVVAQAENGANLGEPISQIRPIENFRYDVPDNAAYGVLKAIIEAQGHQQLKIGAWVPGENDLTPEQIAKLDFSKLDYSSFSISFALPNHGFGVISMDERVRQVSRQKAENDQLVRSLAHEGILHPISDVSLSQDDINQMLADANMSWWETGTPESHAQYISALGMAAARRTDVIQAKFIRKYEPLLIEEEK